MRVLVVAPTLPWPLDAGGRLRTWNLLRALAPRHELELWCVRQDGAGAEAERALRDLGLTLRVFRRARRGALRALSGPPQESWFWSRELARALAGLAPGAFDLVHLDELCLVRALPPDRALPLLQHHHKLDRELAVALAASPARAALDSERWGLLERAALLRTRAHVVCCAEDAARLAARHPGLRARVVPNGVDLERFRPTGAARDPQLLLALGSLDYEPNVRGLERFLARHWAALRARRPALRLALVGRGADRARLAGLPAGVELVGAVPDPRPWLARAAALVVPLEVGGGTRLKIVEAAAMGCPVLATAVGAEGLALEHGTHLLAARDLGELAARLPRELAEPGALAARAERARAVVGARYGWGALADELESAWSAAAAAARPRAHAPPACAAP